MTKEGKAGQAGIHTRDQMVKYLVKFGKTEKKANECIDAGISVEMEHTKSKEEAMQIAFDHLTEFHGANQFYYMELSIMEKKLKAKK